VRSNSGSQVLRTSHPQLRPLSQEELHSQQQHQLIANRYATVGRNSNHHNQAQNGFYSASHFFQPSQQTDYQQQTIQAQVLLDSDHPRHRKGPGQTGSNDSLAARINKDLISNQV